MMRKIIDLITCVMSFLFIIGCMGIDSRTGLAIIYISMSIVWCMIIGRYYREVR